MFEYIKLRNFKSFRDVTFDLRDKNGKAKKLILIYGENGIGKSNLASAFYMLSETLRTMDVREILENILENKPDTLSNEHFLSFFKNNFKDIETLIKENKMVTSEGNLYMEFGFSLNGKSGKYILEMSNEEIVYEYLEYILLKNRGICFEITKDKKFMSEKVFNNRELIDDLQILLNKFWGKHSFLAIIEHDISDKSQEYYKSKISKNFMNVMSFLHNISCDVKIGNKQERGVLGLPDNYLRDYDKGNIDLKDEEKLNKTEKMINLFLTTIYRDIELAYYNREYRDNNIQYNLFVRKRIYGELRDIDFELESTGTQSVLQLLPYMLITVEGSTSIIDEFDTGIHDLLVKNIITSLYDYIEGQLIMTTHNTLLMESGIPKESIYVINEIDNSNKEIKCILKYDNKIHVNTNIRNQYIHGKYNAIPENVKVDFGELIRII
ncbi:AAA family ATPase [Clostridium perfringens]